MSKALKQAIDRDDAEAARTALKTIKDVNRKMAGSNTPLLYACERDAGAVVDVLLDAGAKASASYAGESAFYIAMERGATAAMARLAARGAATDEHIAFAMEHAAIFGHTKAMRFMLEQLKRPVPPTLMLLAARDRAAEIIPLLVAAGGDVHARVEKGDEAGMTPLHRAAASAEVAAIEALLAAGADVNATDLLGRTPLMALSAELEYRLRDDADEAMAALRLLVKSGADGAPTDAFGNDAIDYYEFGVARMRGKTSPKALDALRRSGARGDAPVRRLFDAVHAGDLKAVRAAIAGGADVNRLTPPPAGGATPLDLAASKGSEAIVAALLEAGADPNKPSLHETPLMSAASSGHLAVVKQLLAAGADRDALEPRRPGGGDGRERRNALLAAEDNQEYDVVDYLKSIGATRPKPTDWEPLEPGVESWNDFDELLARGEVPAVAAAVAKVIGGKVELDAYGGSFKPGKRAFVIVRPVGMSWCNVLQLAPRPGRFGDAATRKFAAALAKALAAPVLSVGYSDTSDIAMSERFEPDGKSSRDDLMDRDVLEEVVDAMGAKAPKAVRGKLRQLRKASRDAGDERSSSERLVDLAKSEKFVVAAFGLDVEPGRAVDVEFTGYPPEAFDGVAWVST